MDAFPGLREHRTHQVLIDLFRQEGDDRGQAPAHLDQHMPECGVGGGFILVGFRLPVAPTRAPDIPVAEIIQQDLEPLGGIIGIRVIQVVCDLGNSLVKTAQDPAVKGIV